MLMLSELKKFCLGDEKGRRVKLADVAIKDSAKVDYPPIYRLYYFNGNGEMVSLRWNQVREVRIGERLLKVENLDHEESFSPEVMAKEILLARDVLDNVILDLQNRRATRANDLWLEENESGEFVLRGADVGMRAVIRRLTAGFLGKSLESEMYDWKYIEFLRGNPQAVKNGAGYNMRIARLAAGEIAGFIDSIPYLHAAELIILLPDELAAHVFKVTAPEKQLQILDELEETSSLKLLELISPESAANILKQLSSARSEKILAALTPEKSRKIIEILRFPEGTVGSVMTSDVVFVPRDLTIGKAREYLRERLNHPDFVYFIYTVEDEKSKCLSGIFSLRHLVTASDDAKVADIMDKYVSFLNPLDEARRAAFRVIDSHLAAMPVIDEKGKLLGALTIDAAVSTVAPRGWRDQAPRVFS